MAAQSSQLATPVDTTHDGDRDGDRSSMKRFRFDQEKDNMNRMNCIEIVPSCHLVESQVTQRGQTARSGNDDIWDTKVFSSTAGTESNELLLKITTIYSKRFYSPKWNAFKGVSLELQEITRLNNLIWREWHRQFVAGQRTTHCSFTCLVDDPAHREPQSVVLEEKYWKRKYDAVTEQYRQWRIFWKARRSWSETSTNYVFDKVAQQNDLQTPNVTAVVQRQHSSATWYSSQPTWDLDTLLDAWIPSSDPMKPTSESNLGVVLAQPCHDDVSDLDLVKELFDTCETSSSAEALPVRPSVQLLCIDGMDVQSSAATFQQKMSVDTTIVDRHCSPPCLPCAPPKPIRAMPARSHGKKASSSGRKHRVNVLNGVDKLKDVLPLVAENNGDKLSKAKVMSAAAASCRRMRLEAAKLDEDVALLRCNIDQLQRDLLGAQRSMSTSGIPVPQSASLNCNRPLFDAWVCARSSENCKFALFAQLIAPLFDSFMASVSVLSADELSQSLLVWQQEHFTLGTLRQSVLSSLTDLSKSTSILASPQKFPAELRARASSNDSTDGRFCRQRLS